jgi:two-component system LytT family response regulator
LIVFELPGSPGSGREIACQAVTEEKARMALHHANLAIRTSHIERLLIKVGGSTMVLPVGEIDWIESSANYVKLHVGSQSFLYRQTLSTLAGELDSATFARIHRSTIANLERIREIEPWFSGDGMVILRNGTKLRMSRSYRREVEGRLGMHTG